MDKLVTPQKAVTLVTWGPPPPCKQALSLALHDRYDEGEYNSR